MMKAKRSNTANCNDHSHPSMRRIKFVLFPRDRRVQYWDNLFLCVLLYYCFSIPYMVGVSAGYRLYFNTAWFVINMVFNFIYIADVILKFFRAYYDERGIVVFDNRRIAKNYFFSRSFVLDLIASFPIQLMIYLMGIKYDHTASPRAVRLLTVTHALRLLRITRVYTLTKSSVAIQTWWERQNVPLANLALFLFKLAVVSHFIACLWSFIVFIQVGTFDIQLLKEPNWISNWYKSSYVEGGIDPIGWENDIDRYALSLFWSVQSITSIGYGNITPVTRAEYYLSIVLMLVSGIFWAFVIGNIVSIVAHMYAQENEYKLHLDEANSMIRCFSPTTIGDKDTDNGIKCPVWKCGQTNVGIEDSAVIATRIRKFVTAQYDGAAISSPKGNDAPTISQTFPTLDSFSPELRRLSSLHLMGKYIEMVPYLSHRYLTPEEQSEVAFKCRFLEFSAGESFTIHPQYGRGIMILSKGFCLSMGMAGGQGTIEHICFEMYNPYEPIAANDVLVEDDFLPSDQPLYRFVSYSVVVFIPRSVICEVLNAKDAAWKDCARWKYLQSCLLKWSREKKNVHMEA